jgi:hypothetical protein
MSQTSRPKIEELTPEQQARIPFYLEKFKNIGLSTRPTDRAKAEAAVKRSYTYLKMQEPEIFWAEDPFSGARMAAQFANGVENPTGKQIAEQAEHASYGSFNAYWVAFYSFVARELPVERDELIEIVEDIVEECGVYWTFEDAVILTPKPVKISMVDDKLHDSEDMAIKYANGAGLYAINGELVPSLLEARIEDVLGSKK